MIPRTKHLTDWLEATAGKAAAHPMHWPKYKEAAEWLQRLGLVDVDFFIDRPGSKDIFFIMWKVPFRIEEDP